MVLPARSATLASYHLSRPNDQPNLANSMPSLQPRHRQAHRLSSSRPDLSHPHPSTTLDSVHSHQPAKYRPSPLAQQVMGYRHASPPASIRAVDQDAARQLRQWKAVRRQHGWAMDETVQAVCPQIPPPHSIHPSSSPSRNRGRTSYPSSTHPILISTTPAHTTRSARHNGRRHRSRSYSPERGRQRARCRGPNPLVTPPPDVPQQGPSSQPRQAHPPLTRSSTLPLYKPLFPHDPTPSSKPSTTTTNDLTTTRGLTVPTPNAVPGSLSSSGSSHSSVDTAGTSPSQSRTSTSTPAKPPPSPLPSSPQSFQSARTPTLPSPSPTQTVSLSPPARMRVSPAQPRAALSLAVASATLDASCTEPMQAQHATTVSRLAMVQAMHMQGSEEVSPLSQHVRGLAQQGTEHGLGAHVHALAALEANSSRRAPSPPQPRPTRAPLHRTRSLAQARASRSPSLAVLLGSSSQAPRSSVADDLSYDESTSPLDTGLDTGLDAVDDGALGQARAPLRISIDTSDDPLQRNHQYCMASQGSSPSTPPNEWFAARLSNFHATLQGSRRTSLGSENDNPVPNEEAKDSAVTLRPGMDGLVGAEPLEPQPLGAPAPITSGPPTDEDKVRNKPMGLLAVSLRQFSRLPNYLPNYFTPTAPTGVPAEPVVAETDVQRAWGECSPRAPPPQWGAWGGQMWSPPTDSVPHTVPQAAGGAPGSSKGRGVMTPWEADMSASAYVAGLGEPVDPDVELSSMVCLETYRLHSGDVPEEGELHGGDTARGGASESRSTSPPTADEEEQPTDYLLDPEALAHALQENLFHSSMIEPQISTSPPDTLAAPEEQDPSIQRSSRTAKLSIPSDEPSRGRSRSRTHSADRIRSSAPSSRTSPTTSRPRGQSPPAPPRRLSAHDPTQRQSSPLPRRVQDEVVHTPRRRSEVDAKNDDTRRSRPRRRPSSLRESVLPTHVEDKNSPADSNRRPRRPRSSRSSTPNSSSSGRRTPSSSAERSIHLGRSCSPSFRPRLLANGQHLYMLSLELEMIRKNKITAPLKPRWGKERPRSRLPSPAPVRQLGPAARPPPLVCGCVTSDESVEVRTAQLDRWRFASVAYVQSGLKNQ